MTFDHKEFIFLSNNLAAVRITHIKCGKMKNYEIDFVFQHIKYLYGYELSCIYPEKKIHFVAVLVS